jgi:hypothetical protein
MRSPPPAQAAPIMANDPAVIEQVLYWAESGITPGMALQALGVSWRARRPAGWDDVQYAVASAWRTLAADQPCSSSVARPTPNYIAPPFWAALSGSFQGGRDV